MTRSTSIDEHLLKALLHAVTESMVLIKPDGTILAINETAAHRLGCSAEQMPGRNIYEFLDQEAADRRRSVVAQVVETGQPSQFKDCHAGRRFAHSVHPALDSKGRVTSLAIHAVDVTDLHLAQEALRHSEERYRLLVQHATEGILVGQDGKIVFANPKLVEIAGFPEEEILSRPFTDLLHPEDRQTAMDHHLRRQSGREPNARYTVRAVDKAGRVKWVETRAVQIMWDGRPASLGLVTDVTEQRLADQALRDSQARLASAINAASLGMFEMNVVTGEVFIDDRLRQITGIPKEAEARALDYWAEHLHPEDRATVLDGRHLLMEGQMDRFCAEVRLSHPDRGWVWVHYYANVIERDPQGRSIRHVGAFQDITDRKISEHTIRRAEERFQLAVQGSNDGLWDWPDVTQENQWWSPRFYELLGYENGEIEASQLVWRSLVHPDDLERVLGVVRAACHEGVPMECEYRLRTKSGAYRWFCGRGAVSSDLEGRHMRMSGSLRDITGLRKVQTERLGYQARLKSLTSKLALAEESERRRIAVGVHDDIGQRLVLAKLELQSLQQTCPGPDVAEALERICGQIDCAMQDARSLAFELSNPVLYEVGFSAAVESWLTRQVEKKAGVTCQFGSELAGIRLDENTGVVLFQAVREVVTNAVKHARATRIQVQVLRRDGEVHVVVADDGVGFDPAILEWSGDRQTGLGLFNVRERLEYILGRIQICSAPGHGTTVVLAAPFKSAASPRRRVGP